MTDPQTAADAAERVQAAEAATWLRARLQAMDETIAATKDVPDDECPPTHFSILVRLRSLPDGRVGVYGPEIETTPDRLRALLDEHDALLADRARMAAELEQVRGDLARARDDSSEVWLAERGEEMRDALTVAAELIDRLADAGECKLTAEGLCWWHGATGPAPCPHPLGRRFVEAWRAVQAEATERPDREGAGKGPESHGDATGVDGAPQRTWTTPEAPQGPSAADGASGACEWCNPDTYRMGELCNCARFCGFSDCGYNAGPNWRQAAEPTP